MMKQLIFFFLITFYITPTGSAQVSIEAQAGGANFLGLTINSRFQVPLCKSNEYHFSPSFGIGTLAPWWDEPTLIINAGFTYNYKAWGIGAEISRFTDILYLEQQAPRDFADLIIYPNFNHTSRIGSAWYVRFSGGAYFAFSKSNESGSNENRLQFEGDVIPGAGIGIGYTLKRTK